MPVKYLTYSLEGYICEECGFGEYEPSERDPRIVKCNNCGWAVFGTRKLRIKYCDHEVRR